MHQCMLEIRGSLGLGRIRLVSVSIEATSRLHPCSVSGEINKSLSVVLWQTGGEAMRPTERF